MSCTLDTKIIMKLFGGLGLSFMVSFRVDVRVSKLSGGILSIESG